MKVIVKYEILDYHNVTYGMFLESGEPIPNKRITDEVVPLGGIASSLYWLKQDVHRCTNEIKEIYPESNYVEYELVECNYKNWYNMNKEIEEDKNTYIAINEEGFAYIFSGSELQSYMVDNNVSIYKISEFIK